MNERTERYVDLQGLATGPYSAAKLAEWAGERRLAAGSRVFDPESREWKTVADDAALAGTLPAPLRLEDFTETEPVRHEPPPAKKPVPWREKKKKFWEVRKTEEKIHSLISAYNAKNAAAKERRAAEAAAKAAESAAKAALAREAAREAALAAAREASVAAVKVENAKVAGPIERELPESPVPTFATADFLPSRPASLAVETGAAQASRAETASHSQADALALLEDLFRVDPIPAAASSARAADAEAETGEHYPESNFHKVLFFGFLLLSALFGGVSFWLSRNASDAAKAPTPAALAARAVNPTIRVSDPDAATPVIKVISPGEADLAPLPEGMQVIRGGEIVGAEKTGGPPTSVSTAPPHAPPAVSAESVPQLRPPVRPKRD